MNPENNFGNVQQGTQQVLQQTPPQVPIVSKHEKGFWAGVWRSFLIFIACWLIVGIPLFLFNALYNGLGLETSDFTIQSILHPFLAAIIKSIPFIVVNFIFLYKARNNKRYRNGFIFGYVFIIIYILISFASGQQVLNEIHNTQKFYDAQNSKDPAQCEKLAELYPQDPIIAEDQCFVKVAYDLNDVTICNKMTLDSVHQKDEQYMRDVCYSIVFSAAAETGDSSVCNIIENSPTVQSRCVSVAQALAHNDFSCSQVKDNNSQLNYCLKGVQKNPNWQKYVNSGTWQTYTWGKYIFSYPAGWKISEYPGNGYCSPGLYIGQVFQQNTNDALLVEPTSDPCAKSFSENKCTVFNKELSICTVSQNSDILNIFQQIISKIKIQSAH